MSATRRRVAWKAHQCGSGLCPIRPGDVYLVHTIFPGNEAGYLIEHPVRLAECAACATRHGRGHLLALDDAAEQALDDDSEGYRERSRDKEF